MQHVPILASFICLVLSCVNEIHASCPNRTTLNSYLTMDRKLWDHVIKAIPGVLSPYQCADACLRDERCKSFNYIHKKDSDDINVCELKDINWNDVPPGGVTKKTGWDLYDVDFERLQEVSMLYKVALTSKSVD